MESKSLFPVYLCQLLQLFCSCSYEIFCVYRALVKFLHGYCSVIKLLFQNLKDWRIQTCKARLCSLSWTGSSSGVVGFFSSFFCITVFDHLQNSEAGLDSFIFVVLVNCADVYKTLFFEYVLILFWIDGCG